MVDIAQIWPLPYAAPGGIHPHPMTTTTTISMPSQPAPSASPPSPNDNFDIDFPSQLPHHPPDLLPTETPDPLERILRSTSTSGNLDYSQSVALAEPKGGRGDAAAAAAAAATQQLWRSWNSAGARTSPSSYEEFLRRIEEEETPPGVDGGPRSRAWRRGGGPAQLGKVLEETESFTRREFGSMGAPNYMDCSSGNQGANYGLDDWRRRSPRSSNAAAATDLSRIKTGNGGGAGKRKAVAIRGGVRRRRGGVAAAVLWPLRKVRDAYVSCMMGLDSAVDLTAVGGGSAHHRSPAILSPHAR